MQEINMDYMRTTIVSCFLVFIIWVMCVDLYAKAPELPKYELYVDEVTAEFIQEIQKEYPLVCIGNGGSMPYDVETIKIMFLSHEKASIDKAREIEVKAIEKLINIVNAHKKIRPFLREYPFTNSRAEISISFTNKKLQPYADGLIARISQVHGQLLYRSYDPTIGRNVVLLKEPYEEAKQKVLPFTKGL